MYLKDENKEKEAGNGPSKNKKYTTAYHLGRCKPPSPSIKELHAVFVSWLERFFMLIVLLI